MKITARALILWSCTATAAVSVNATTNTLVEDKNDVIRDPNSFDWDGKSPNIPVYITDKGSPDIDEVDHLRRSLYKKAKKVKKSKKPKKQQRQTYDLFPCPTKYLSTHTTAAGSGKQYRELNEWAMKSFVSERGSATSPAFTSFSKNGVDPQGVMCSVVYSVFNSIYPGNPQDYQIANNYTNYFHQGTRDDCNIAATAFTYARDEPYRMISLIARLYWQGIISTSTEIPKPRKYALDLDWNPKSCKRISTFPLEGNATKNCQGPAMFIYSVGMRDALNVQILKGDKSLVKYSNITATPDDGRSYFALSRGMEVWTKWLGMKTPSVIQGDCKNSENREKCVTMLDGMLPYEVSEMNTWYTEYLKFKAGKRQLPKQYTNKTFPKVIAVTKQIDVVYNSYMKPMSVVDSTSLPTICKESKGKHVYLGINSCLLPSYIGEYYYAGTTDADIRDRCSQSSCIGSHCVQDHWVVMLTDFCDEATIWSWGQTWTFSFEDVASVTTSIVHGF